MEEPNRKGEGELGTNDGMDEDRPSDTFQDDEPLDLVPVINVPSSEEAELVLGILRQEAIPATLEQEASTMTEALDASALDGVDVIVPRRFLPLARRVLAAAGLLDELDASRLDSWFEERVRPQLGPDASGPTGLLEELTERSRGFAARFLERLIQEGEGARPFLERLLREAFEAEEETPLVYDLPKALLQPAVLAALGLDPHGLADWFVRLAEGAARPSVRVNLARALGRIGTEAVPALIELLDDPEVEVRDEALESLYFISNGFDFGFDPEGSESERRSAIARWRDWYERGARRRGD